MAYLCEIQEISGLNLFIIIAKNEQNVKVLSPEVIVDSQNKSSLHNLYRLLWVIKHNIFCFICLPDIVTS